jgi:hypothetical protein
MSRLLPALKGHGLAASTSPAAKAARNSDV